MSRKPVGNKQSNLSIPERNFCSSIRMSGLVLEKKLESQASFCPDESLSNVLENSNERSNLKDRQVEPLVKNSYMKSKVKIEPNASLVGSLMKINKKTNDVSNRLVSIPKIVNRNPERLVSRKQSNLPQSKSPPGKSSFTSNTKKPSTQGLVRASTETSNNEIRDQKSIELNLNNIPKKEYRLRAQYVDKNEIDRLTDPKLHAFNIGKDID